MFTLRPPNLNVYFDFRLCPLRTFECYNLEFEVPLESLYFELRSPFCRSKFLGYNFSELKFAFLIEDSRTLSYLKPTNLVLSEIITCEEYTSVNKDCGRSNIIHQKLITFSLECLGYFEIE